MLIIIDTDDWVYAMDGTKEAEASFELQDVEEDEYQACDEEGRLYQFVVEGVSFRLVPGDVIDADLPTQLISRLASRHSFTEADITRLLTAEKDYAGVVAYIETHGKWQRQRQI